MMEIESPNKKSSSTSRSLADIRCARENRTAEALRIKDEQIRILTEQNNKLLDAIEKGEEEISALQLEKLHIDEENRQLRESNFSVQSKSKVVDDELEKRITEAEELGTQLKVVTAQHSELVKMMETEEATNAKLAGDLESSQEELRELKAKHVILSRASETNQDRADQTSKKCEIQSNEIRLLQTEIQAIKTKQNESAMKSSVEIESLQEQLRVRKEKQYQLLEKLQSQEEARRKAEDQVSSLEESIKALHTKSSSAETQLQLEISTKLSQSDTINRLSENNEKIKNENIDLQGKMHEVEQDNLRMEAEARDSSEKLREMAEKVFQLLERLKIAELGKTRSMDALRGKEEEVHGLKKKNANLSKENEKEEKLRTKLQLDKKVLEEQIKDMKKQTIQLGQKCKEEARLKIRMDDERKEAEGKVKTLNGRVSFLLNKLQIDEETRSMQREEIEKLQKQLQSSKELHQSMQQEINKSHSKIQSLSDELGTAQQELETTKIKLEALQQLVDEQDEMHAQSKNREKLLKTKDESPLLAGGRLRFFVESKPTLGLFAMKAKCAKDREWLETNDCNLFMRKASKSQHTQDLLLQKIAETYGIIVTYEEEVEKMKSQIQERNMEIEKVGLKVKYMHEKLSLEEESKRRTLLKYINAVKASVSLGEDGCEKDREEVGSIGAGKINLPEANLTDEEVHAISALLRKNETIAELNLQGNLITDEGCRSLSSVLSGPSSLHNIDLRRNRISRNGIKIIVEALQRSERVRHVHVHAGGKIEAMGCRNTADITNNTCQDVQKSSVCIVDIRENSKPEDSDIIKEEVFGLPITFQETQPEAKKVTRSVPNIKQKVSETERGKRRKMQQKVKIKEERQTREKGWVGRAGGLEVSKNSIGGRGKRETGQDNALKNNIGRSCEDADIKNFTSISPFS